MELAQIKGIKGRIPTVSGMVELLYKNTNGNLETRPGYLTNIEDRNIEDIPVMWRDSFKKRHTVETPLVELAAYLERNQCPREPLDIRVEDIEAIKILGLVYDTESKYPSSDVVEVRYENERVGAVTQPGYLKNMDKVLAALKGEDTKPDIELYTFLDENNVPQEPLKIEGKNILWARQLVIVESFPPET